MKVIDDKLTEVIIGCCYEVMNVLGTGFMEAVYKNALRVELTKKGLRVQTEVPLNVYYKGVNVGFYKADLIVENAVIIELKCCKSLAPEHSAQGINYLHASGMKIVLLVNFGNPTVDIKRLEV